MPGLLEVLQVLEHVVINGAARNPGELERLLGLLEQARGHATTSQQPAAAAGVPAPAPVPVPPAPVSPVDQPPGGAL